MSGAAETVILEKFSEAQKNTHVEGGTEGGDSDDEEGQGQGQG